MSAPLIINHNDTDTEVTVVTMKSGLAAQDVKSDIQDTLRAHCGIEGDFPLQLCMKVGEKEWQTVSLGVLVCTLAEKIDEKVAVKIPGVVKREEASVPFSKPTSESQATDLQTPVQKRGRTSDVMSQGPAESNTSSQSQPRKKTR